MMRIGSTILATLLLASALPAAITIEETRDQVRAQVTVEPTSTTLSGQVTLTLTVEGPARVDVQPGALLTKASLQNWLITEESLPTVEVLPGERNRRVQIFQLQPFGDESKMEIALAPLKVRAGTLPEIEITWSKPIEIEVTTTAKADPATLEPSTGPEPPPHPDGPKKPREQWIVVAIVTGATLLTALGILLLVLRTRPAAPIELCDTEWALRQLDRLAPLGDVSAGVDVLRRCIETLLKLPAMQLTSREVLDRARQTSAFPDDQLRKLESILEQGDLAKFAGRTQPVDTVAWFESAYTWLNARQAIKEQS